MNVIESSRSGNTVQSPTRRPCIWITKTVKQDIKNWCDNSHFGLDLSMSTRWSCLCHAMDPAAETGSACCEGLFAWPPPANELSSVDADNRTMDPAPNVGPAPNCPAGSSLLALPLPALTAHVSHRHYRTHAHTHRHQGTATDSCTDRLPPAIYRRRSRPRHHAPHIISTSITHGTALTTLP